MRDGERFFFGSFVFRNRVARRNARGRDHKRCGARGAFGGKCGIGGFTRRNRRHSKLPLAVGTFGYDERRRGDGRAWGLGAGTVRD